MREVRRQEKLPGKPLRDGAPGWRFVDPLTFGEEAWDDGLPEDIRMTTFHRQGWAHALSETYGYRPRFLVSEAVPGRLRGVIPCMEVRSPLTGARGVSLPFTDVCESVTPTESGAPPCQLLLDAGGRRGWRRIDFHGQPPESLIQGDEAPPVWKRYYRHRVECLESADAQRASLAPAHRRAIRKASDHGVRVVFSDTWDAVRQYYRLHCHTRKRHGAPPQPLTWFRALHRRCLGEGKGFVALALNGETPISGGVFFLFRNRALYKYGASDYRYADLRGANAVFWNVLRRLSSLKCRELDFGVTSVAHEGLRRFKRGWGCRETAVQYYRYDFTSGRFLQGPTGGANGDKIEKFFTRAPIWVLRIFGKLLYPHVA